MISTGIIVRGYIPIPEILKPWEPEASESCWLISAQSGPFKSEWTQASSENKALVDNQFIWTKACADSCSSCWLPGTLPRLAPHIKLDEWTYLFAMRCNEVDVERRAAWISRGIGKYDEKFFKELESASELFAMHVDGWWEIYSNQPGVYDRYLRAFPAASERSWKLVTEGP